MVYADKRSGLRSDAEYISDPNAAWIPPAYKGKVRDPPVCAQVRRGKVTVSAAKSRCDRFNHRRPPADQADMTGN
ncbi:hypothetical protein BCBMB205_15950 [Bacillus sp. CN2]|nr:hypothetical protein BCBMB205_15950 [Bacillus velezensis]ARZ57929.1 hypothetical protein BAGQ_1695 [Bacillus velezensis]BCU86218.1 hypothetical protein KOF112_14830 [Bacillus velezensis]GFR53609.1 hypothetical protein BCBMB205_15950 [Bacillus sp. CN2]